VVDGEEVGRTVVGPDGMWSVTPNVPLPTGEQTITVIAQGEDGINEEVTVVVTVGDSDSTDMVLAGGCNAGGAAGPSGLAALWLLLPWGLARRKRRVS
jgi:hypothetical protein